MAEIKDWKFNIKCILATFLYIRDKISFLH
jgi:hypothetical protein